MLLVPLRKELRQLWRDGRFRLLAVVGTVVVLSSVVLAHADVEAMRGERRAGQERSRAQWEEQGTKNPHTAAHYGVHVFRQPGGLAVFDPGILSFSGASVFLEAHEQNLPVHALAQDGTLARRLGEWVPANVLQTLVPLMVIVLMFGSVAQERENGSLVMLRSAGGSVRWVAWAKLLAGGLAIGTTLLLPVAVGAALLGSWEGVDLGDLLPRALGLALAYGLYLGGFLLLGLIVSMRAKTARGALVLLLGIWVAWVVVLPRVFTNAAGDAHPLPRWAETQHKLAQAQGLVLDSQLPYERRVESLTKETLAKYDVEDPSTLPVNFGGVMLIAGEEWGNEAFDRHFGELYDTYRAQEDVLRRSSWLAPVLALRSISMDLSGAGLEDEIAFRRAAELHRRAFVLQMNEAVRDHPEAGFAAGAELWRSVPPFRYEAPTASSVLRRHVSDFGVLAAWWVFGVVGLCWAIRALDREAV